MSLKILNLVLNAIVIVSKTLQLPGLDLFEAMDRINSLYKILDELRNNDATYDEIYLEACALCEKLDIEITFPKNRTRKISARIDDRPDTAVVIEGAKEYFKFFAFNTLIDSLLSGLRERFNQETKEIPTAVGKITKLQFEKHHLTIVCDQFDLNLTTLQAELNLLKNSDDKPKFFHMMSWLDWFNATESRKITFKNFFKLVVDF